MAPCRRCDRDVTLLSLPQGCARPHCAQDFCQCTHTTAGLIRAGKWQDVDAEAMAEELETLGRSERHAIWSYLAGVLARYQDREGLSHAALAARLSLATVDLPRRPLCIRPRAEQWTEDLAQIGARFSLEPKT